MAGEPTNFGDFLKASPEDQDAILDTVDVLQGHERAASGIFDKLLLDPSVDAELRTRFLTWRAGLDAKARKRLDEYVERIRDLETLKAFLALSDDWANLIAQPAEEPNQSTTDACDEAVVSITGFRNRLRATRGGLKERWTR